MIVIDETRHRFDGAEPELGVLTAASYRWHCPDCGRTNYEQTAVHRVHCPRCGGSFNTTRAEHNGQTRLL